jgi:hypothetical protein
MEAVHLFLLVEAVVAAHFPLMEVEAVDHCHLLGVVDYSHPLLASAQLPHQFV